MTNIEKYAQMRAQITLLENELKAIEKDVIAELGTEKGADTELGRVGTVATYIYSYSDELKAKKLAAKDQIKDLTTSLMEPIKEAEKAEEEAQEPTVKLSIRFIPRKEEV